MPWNLHEPCPGVFDFTHLLACGASSAPLSSTFNLPLIITGSLSESVPHMYKLSVCVCVFVCLCVRSGTQQVRRGFGLSAPPTIMEHMASCWSMMSQMR